MEWGRWYAALCLVPSAMAALVIYGLCVKAKQADKRMERDEYRDSAEVQDASTPQRNVRHAT
jgi:hypothetical protein